MTPILVLALNPSMDVEWRVKEVLWEEKNHIDSERRWAGGKGINVARWLGWLGGKPKLLLPLGGAAGKELTGCLQREISSANVAIIPIRTATRINIIVTTTAGRQMRFNPSGPRLIRAEWRRLQLATRKLSSPGGLLVLSGSLPPGVPNDAYARLIRQARKTGVGTLLDCDGTPLRSAVAARPFLVKPNEHELAQWWGRAVRSEAQALQAARAMSEATGGWVLVSRGGKRGLLVNRPEGFQQFAAPPRGNPCNRVGAGDALLAAVAREIQLGSTPLQWLHQGLRVGARATQLPAGHLPA